MRTLAGGQHGLLTRAQLAELAVTRAVRRRLVDRGDLVPVGQQVFRIGGVPASERQAILAACLDVGGVASHRTAAWLHRLLTGFDRMRAIEVVVERPRAHATTALAQVHSTTWLPAADLVVVDGIPCLGVPRTLLSLAALVPRELTFDQVKGAVDLGVTSGIAHEKWLWWRLERLRRSGRNGVRVLEAILLARAAGEITESWLERETLRVIGGAGLPLPVCQARIGARGAFVARVDFRYPGTMAIIEVNGHRFHASREQLRRDAQRRRGLVALGFSVYDFTYDEVVQEPEAVLVTVRHILGLPLAA